MTISVFPRKSAATATTLTNPVTKTRASSAPISHTSQSSGAGSFLHLWGPNAVDNPRGIARGSCVEFVVVPTYWGEYRKALLAHELADSEHDAVFVDPAGVLLSLQPPTVSTSILVEVEAKRICISLLDFEEQLVCSRIIPTDTVDDGDVIVETFIAAACQLSENPESGLDPVDGETVNARCGITSYSPLWRESVEFIVAEAGQHGFGNDVATGEPFVGKLRRRGFLAYEFPMTELEQYVVKQQQAVEIADTESDLAQDLTRSDKPTLAVSEIRQRLKKQDSVLSNRQDRHGTPGARMVKIPFTQLEPARVGVGLLALLAIAGVISGAIFLAGQRKDLDVAAAGLGIRTSEPSNSQTMNPSRAAPSDTSPQTRAPSTEPRIAPNSNPNETRIPASAPEGFARFEAAGVMTHAPAHFLHDESSAENRLVLYDGDRMRMIVMATPVAAETTLDDVMARMVAQSAAGGTMSGAVKTVVSNTEVVTMEERLPSGRSVVLWHYRLVAGKQVSVGCQYRGVTIPAVRSDCDAAVERARPT